VNSLAARRRPSTSTVATSVGVFVRLKVWAPAAAALKLWRSCPAVGVAPARITTVTVSVGFLVRRTV
jgi:hypothetical protein